MDLAHLRYVHGYDNVDPVQEVSVDGPSLETSFDFKIVRKIAGVANLSFDCSARVRVLGLGYSFVQVREQSIGMDLRLWVLATPVDGAPIMNKFISSQQREDVLQDVVIWSRKQYKSRPRLCRSDGKIMPFRAYCAQFYMDPND